MDLLDDISCQRRFKNALNQRDGHFMKLVFIIGINLLKLTSLGRALLILAVLVMVNDLLVILNLTLVTLLKDLVILE